MASLRLPIKYKTRPSQFSNHLKRGTLRQPLHYLFTITGMAAETSFGARRRGNRLRLRSSIDSKAFFATSCAVSNASLIVLPCATSPCTSELIATYPPAFNFFIVNLITVSIAQQYTASPVLPKEKSLDGLPPHAFFTCMKHKTAGAYSDLRASHKFQNNRGFVSEIIK